LPSSEALNNELKEILKGIKPTWDNIGQIKELQRAIKAKYDNTKLAVIKRYKVINR